MSFKSNPGVHWPCFTLLCDRSKKLAPLLLLWALIGSWVYFPFSWSAVMITYALICKEQNLLQSKKRPKSNLDGKDEFRPSFVKPNPKQTQRTKGSKQRKNANQLKLTFYLMLGKTRVTKSQLLLALNLVGLEEVGTSKSEIVQFSFECLICVDSASLCSVIGSENLH